MAATTGIDWCDSTFNGWIGCTEVTPACDNCYARVLSARMGWAEWGRGKPRKLTSEANWRKPLAWDKSAPKKLGRKARVFAHSLSDVFDVEVPDEWRTRLFGLMAKTVNTNWLVLTKRASVPRRYAGEYPAEKMWLGTSLGSDRDLYMAFEIARAKAAIHWISYEPAIGPLDIDQLPDLIRWVVIGGESGNGARPFNIEWALDAVRKCKERGIKVFMKQLGANPFRNGGRVAVSDSHGKNPDDWPIELYVKEFPEM